jgi:hypothetical protein
MKFKCKVSGTIVEFTAEYDVESMLTNPAYEVVEEKLVEPEKEKVVVKNPTKE